MIYHKIKYEKDLKKWLWDALNETYNLRQKYDLSQNQIWKRFEKMTQSILFLTSFKVPDIVLKTYSVKGKTLTCIFYF